MTATLDELLADDPQPQRQRRWWRRLVAIVGVLMLVAGLSILGWAAWQFYGTNIVAKHRQTEVQAELRRQWDDSRDPDALGDAVALLRVPRFGADYQMPIVKGVDDGALSSGVGWFPNSQRPGALGNFALAGHRVTHGEPFRDFPELREGDAVYVETRTHIFTYTLDDDGSDHTVPFDETWILDPVPGDPDAEPTEALVTLMTCSEIFDTEDRSYVVGHLTRTESKTPGT